jgi:DNA polymerase-3 subunit epsilon
MIVLGFDTETTGLDVKEDFVIQIGAVLWDTEAKTKHAKMKMDRLIKGAHIKSMKPDAIASHGISLEDLKKYGVPFEIAYVEFMAMAREADYIVAHNAPYDREIFNNNCLFLGVEPINKGWIDTSTDIEFPTHVTTRKLGYLATEHGFINPFPHDAASDVLTMLSIAQKYDWKHTLKYAKAPNITIKAETNFAQKELAKKQNYRWDGAAKEWTKTIKDFQLEETKKAASEAGFKITILKKESQNV